MYGRNYLILSLGLVLTACVNDQWETTSGAVTMGFNYESVDFALLVDPQQTTAAKYSGQWAEMSAEEKGNLAWADYQAWERETGNAAAAIVARDQIQDRLFGTSNQLCHIYELRMQDLSSQGNFWAGVVTTTAGTAGALFSGGTTQILSAIAAISNGSRAEFNQDFFYKEAVPAIFKGIKASRKELYDQILAKRGASDQTAQPVPVTKYNLNAAINDAIYYHWSCSMASGIAYLGSLTNPGNPVGLSAAQNTTGQIGGTDNLNTAQANLLDAPRQVTENINALTNQFESTLKGQAKLAASQKSIMTKVSDRKTKTVETLNACSGKVLELANNAASAREALRTASGADLAMKQAAANVAASNATLLAAKLRLAGTAYGGELDKLSQELAKLPAGGDGNVDAAAVDKVITEAYKAPPADLGCGK